MLYELSDTNVKELYVDWDVDSDSVILLDVTDPGTPVLFHGYEIIPSLDGSTIKLSLEVDAITRHLLLVDFDQLISIMVE